jgi:hypothetical protein
MEVMFQRVFPPSKFARFCDLYFTGRREARLFEFHEACTNILRGTNLQVLPRRNKVLNRIIDDYVWRLEEARDISPLGDFLEHRTSFKSLPLSR